MATYLNLHYFQDASMFSKILPTISCGKRTNNCSLASGIIFLLIIVICQIGCSKDELADVSKDKFKYTEKDLPTLLKMFEEASKNNDPKYSHIFSLIAGIGADNIEPIIEYAKKIDPKDREDILSIFSVIGDHRAIPIIIESLKSENPKVRSRALQAIRDIPDARAYEPALQMLSDHDKEVRVEALLVLCTMPDYRSLRPIREMYATHPDGDLQAMLICALGVLHANEYGDEFLREYSLLGKDDPMHESFVSALGELNDAQAFDVLRKGFLDKSRYDRISYGMALKKIPDLRKWDVFYQVWNDKSERPNLLNNIRSFAALALADSCSPYELDAARWILEKGNVFEKVSVIKILGKKLSKNHRKATLKLLKYALKDDSDIVRNAAKVELALDLLEENSDL
jgi:HEAT repeat protein